MADLGSDDRFNSRSRSHRIERSERRIAHRYIEATSNNNRDYKSRNNFNEQEDMEGNASVGNDLSSNANDREATRRERRAERRRMREEKDKDVDVEAPTSHEEPVEQATLSPEPQEQPKRSLKKERGKSENIAKKRQAKKNLREKRRSTGVVIMPNEKESTDDEEEKKALKENTILNASVGDEEIPLDSQMDNLSINDSYPGMESPSIKDSNPEETHTSMSRTRRKKDREHREYRSSGSDYESLDKAELIQRLEECQDSLGKANKEIERLREENKRLNNEHSALLRVVSQLSTKK